ncbi:hypothetical protein CRG98_018667 [Punica granatum]|uniref:Uncharacterized protein n=1 Tax=Punica granatum TaxID=22663 RepID=A0A2I0JX83_PUNGR|nr:hypothetical protein CRG98_018667 [Punica granatum]
MSLRTIDAPVSRVETIESILNWATHKLLLIFIVRIRIWSRRGPHTCVLLTQLGSVHLPEGLVTDTHEMESPLSVYDPKVKGRLISRSPYRYSNLSKEIDKGANPQVRGSVHSPHISSNQAMIAGLPRGPGP